MSLKGFRFADMHDRESQCTCGLSRTLHLHLVDDLLREETECDGIIGQSSALRQVLQLVEMVAKGDSTVLLLGETYWEAQEIFSCAASNVLSH